MPFLTKRRPIPNQKPLEALLYWGAVLSFLDGLSCAALLAHLRRPLSLTTLRTFYCISELASHQARALYPLTKSHQERHSQIKSE